MQQADSFNVGSSGGMAESLGAAPDCTEPNRSACPRLCIDFCNKAEQAATERGAAIAFLEAYEAESALLERESIGRKVSDATYFKAALRTSKAAHDFRAALGMVCASPMPDAVERCRLLDELIQSWRDPGNSLEQMERRIQARAAVEEAWPAGVNGGDGQQTVREFTNELGNRIRITIEGPTSRSENVLTPMEAAELRAGLDTHDSPSSGE